MIERGLKRPIRRGPLRARVGLAYHQARRRLANALDRRPYAAARGLQDLSHSIKTHRTPLFRPLKDVDRALMEAKVFNLRRAVEAIDGLIIRPGESFSYWRRLGPPTRARGFVPGFALENGRIIASPGGGLCQSSNLLFWLVAHSPLTLLERWRHSYDVFPDAARTQPFGSGATVAFNHRDFRFTNHTTATFQLRLWLSPSHLHGALNADAPLRRPIRIEESDHQIKSLWWGGYARSNTLWQVEGDVRTLLVKNAALLLYEPLIAPPKPSPRPE